MSQPINWNYPTPAESFNMNSNQSRKVIRVAEELFYADFIDEVVEEIQTKAFLVQAKMDSFSKAEALAYWILKKNGYFNKQLTTEEMEEMKSPSTSPTSSCSLTSRTSPAS